MTKKYFQILLVFSLNLLFSLQIAVGDVINVPMNFDYWQTNSTDNWEQSEAGIMLYGKQSEMTSKKMFNFIGSQVFIKWQGQYPYLQSSSGNALLAGDITGQATNLDSIWYYSRITVNSDNTYKGVTAIDNYDVNGGTVINNKSGIFDGADNGYIIANLTNNDLPYSLLGEVKVVTNSSNEKSTRRIRRNPDLTFNYSINLSWNDYQKKTESYSIVADGSTSGTCHYEVDEKFPLNIPFQQNINISRSASGYCSSHITQYSVDGSIRITFASEQIIDGNNLELFLHARNERKGFPTYSCKSCTVSVTATYFGEVDTTPQQSNLVNYIGKISYTQDKQELQRVSTSTITSQFNDGMVKDIQCTAISDNSNVTISCEKVGEEFIVYAKSNIIPPVADFTASPELGSITLNASASYDSVGNIVTYNWTASDGKSKSFTTNEQFTWDFNEGTYEICLIVVDDTALESEKKCETVSVDVCKYTVNPTNFADLDSNSNDINIIVQASGERCSWQVTSNMDWLNISGGYVGNKTINYSILDNKNTERRCGDLTIAEQQISVCQKGNQLPVVNSLTFPQEEYHAPVEIAFTSKSTDDDGYISNHIWAGEGYEGAGDTVYFYFEQEGEYTISLVVMDDDEASSKAVSKTITILPPLYELNITTSNNGNINVDDNTCGMPCVKTYVKDTQVKLNAKPSTGAIFTGWNGGGCSGNNPSCVVAMNQAKSVTANFILCSYQIDKNNQTYDEKSNTGSIKVTAPTGCTWQAVSHNLDWLTITSNTTGNGSGIVNYSVKLNSYTDIRNGNIIIAGETFKVTQAANGIPIASFTATPLSDKVPIKAPITVQLDASASKDPSNNKISYDWSSSDGQLLSGKTPQITYQDDGTYIISLKVEDEYGIASTNTATQSIYVDIPSYTLTVNKSIAGNVKGGNIDCGINCKQQYLKDKQVILTAEANNDAIFVDWNGANCTGSTNKICTVSMTANQNITANFRNCNYGIEGNTDKNHGSDNSNGIVNIKAYPGCEWTATTNVDWLNINSSNGSGTGTVNYSVNPNTDLDLREGTITIAGQTFTISQAGEKPVLTIGKDGDGNGTITGNGINCGDDCNEEYDKDTIVTLTATPSDNSIFESWDNACKTDITCSITMDESQSITTKFTAKYSLNVIISGNGAGNVSIETEDETLVCDKKCSHLYEKDALVTLIANSTDERSEFLGWNGDYELCSGISDTCIVPMDNSKFITATFSSDNPEACFTFDYAEEPLTINADASCSDTEIIKDYQWKIMDATMQPIDDLATSSTTSGRTINIPFPKQGKYILELTVTDENGAKGTNIQTVIFDEELVFVGLRPSYKVDDIFSVRLLEKLELTKRNKRVDLWVALKMPDGQFLFMTKILLPPFVDFVPVVQAEPFKTSLEIADKSHGVLNFEVPPDVGGDYTLYAAYLKEGKKPLNDDGDLNLFDLRSNLAKATTVVHDRAD